MKLTTVGIDLAKNVFQVHGIDEHGKVLVKKQLRRDQMATFFVNLPPCLIGMEACGSAHHWARKLQAMGHTVRLMAPQFVKPYVKSNKNDAADAEAICEAVGRPNMRFVPIKNTEQQKWLRLFVQLSPIFKWTAGGSQTVQSCPRRRRSLATNRPTRWATRGAPQTSSYAAMSNGGGVTRYFSFGVIRSRRECGRCVLNHSM